MVGLYAFMCSAATVNSSADPADERKVRFHLLSAHETSRAPLHYTRRTEASPWTTLLYKVDPQQAVAIDAHARSQSISSQVSRIAPAAGP